MKHRSSVILLFFLAFLGLGLAIVDDYGVSWDEAIQRRHGRVSLDYAAERLGLNYERLEPDHHLESYPSRHYGMVYSMACSLIESVLDLKSNYAKFRMRHQVCFLLFWVACLLFYRTLRIRWPDRAWYPLVGTGLLILSPRIFAHGFFNPKDHVLLVGYLAATWSLFRLLERPVWRNLILHALLTGLALNTRLPALVIPVATVAVLLWRQAFGWRDRRLLVFAGIYPPLAFSFMVLFFPYLWTDGLSRFLDIFTEMSTFKWEGKVAVLGEKYSGADLPWFYIPAWMVVTTPLVYLLFLFVGWVASLRRFPAVFRREGMLYDFIQVGLSVLPVVMVIVLGSTLYNGWRHLHFVWPGMVYTIVVGWDWARTAGVRVPVGRAGADGLLAFGITLTAATMIWMHPHQQTYFNYALRGDPLVDRFAGNYDYWGIHFRRSLLDLAETVPEGEKATVLCLIYPCEENYRALPAGPKSKLRLLDDWEKAEFVATNFRWGEERRDWRARAHHFRYPVVEYTPRSILIGGTYRNKRE